MGFFAVKTTLNQRFLRYNGLIFVEHYSMEYRRTSTSQITELHYVKKDTKRLSDLTNEFEL